MKASPPCLSFGKPEFIRNTVFGSQPLWNNRIGHTRPGINHSSSDALENESASRGCGMVHLFKTLRCASCAESPALHAISELKKDW
jgi:hypothetical protein